MAAQPATGELNVPGGEGIGNRTVGPGHLEGSNLPLLVGYLFDLVDPHEADQDERHQLQRTVAGLDRDDGVQVVATVRELGNGQLPLVVEGAAQLGFRLGAVSTGHGQVDLSASSTRMRSSLRSAIEMSRRAR